MSINCYTKYFFPKKKDIKYNKMIDLTEEQIKRYSRHILLQDVGLEGQEKLLNAKVLIIGAGGLGSPVALYLAAAGVEIGRAHV